MPSCRPSQLRGTSGRSSQTFVWRHANASPRPSPAASSPRQDERTSLRRARRRAPLRRARRPLPRASRQSPRRPQLPLRAIADEVAETIRMLSPIMEGKKPPLSRKLLSRPPHRYLHDILSVVRAATGFSDGLFTDEELVSSKQTPRATKISFLQKLAACASIGVGCRINVDPEQIVAGLECAKTNRLLQCVAQIATSNSDKASFLTLSTRTLKGEQPPALPPAAPTQESRTPGALSKGQKRASSWC